MPVVSFADVTDGIHGSPVWVEEGGVTYLSAKCVKDNYFVLTDAGQISREQDEQNPRTRARLSDVLLTTVGTIGNAAVVYEDILPANMDRHLGIIRIRRNAGVDPHYLAAFLNSEYGRLQTLREATGNVQLNLFIEKIKALLVPTGDHFNGVGQTVRQAYQKRRDSEDLYAQAQALLTAELGLDRLDLSEGLYSVRRASEAAQAGRIDAEFFRPKYYRLLAAIQQCPYQHEVLGQLIEPIRNGFDYREFIENGTPYIRVGDVHNGRIDLENAVQIPMTQPEVPKNIGLQVGDVLFTRKGTFGNAAVVREGQEQAIISSEIMLLRLCKGLDRQLLPDYLSLFLNSDFGYQQVERRVHGVAYYSISQPDLAEVQIIIPPFAIQEQMAEKVWLSLAAYQDAKRLLAEARAEVERMIEAA